MRLCRIAFLCSALALYLRRVRCVCRAVILKQPEPVQLSEHVVTRAAGMTVHDQLTWTISERERCAFGLMPRAVAAPPAAGFVGCAEGAGDLLGSAHAALDRNSASAACHCGDRCRAVPSEASSL